jgi:hypothetical protein
MVRALYETGKILTLSGFDPLAGVRGIEQRTEDSPDIDGLTYYPKSKRNDLVKEVLGAQAVFVEIIRPLDTQPIEQGEQ